jgi:hypothetical protein
LCGCSGFARRSSGPRFENWLPADTAAMVAVSSVERLRERWPKTALGQAWSDSSAQYWRSQQLDPVVEKLLARAGVPNGKQVLSLISGPAAVALVLPGNAAAPDRDWAFYAIADFGPNAEEAKRLTRAKPVEKMEEQVESGAREPRLRSAWVGRALVLASSREKLDDLVQRAKKRGLFFGGTKKTPSLASTEVWQKAAGHMIAGADAQVFVNVSCVNKGLLRAAERRGKQGGRQFQGEGARLMIKALGFETIDFAVLSVEMRDKGFYRRAVTAFRDGQPGLATPPRDPMPLKTPQWVTRDVQTFHAMRLRPPLEMKQSLHEMLALENPILETLLKKGEKRLGEKMGVKLDTLLGSFGSELAILSNKSAPLPGVTLLWQIRDRGDLEKSMKELRRALKMTTRQESAAGQTYSVHRVGSWPMPVYTAEIGGFFVLATQDGWIKDFAARRETMLASPQDANPTLPAGPNSLLPELEKPFGKVPDGMVVVGRSYADPGPSLAQLGAMLPLAIPMVNLQLQLRGLPALPSWVSSAIPPFAPFARNSFPAVSRSLQQGSALTIDESWSSSDLSGSPFAAAALAIAARCALKE